MGGGETYVEITGGAANNGIMTLAGSSEGGGGSTISGAWLRWTSNGFTSMGWFPNETPIDEWWAKYSITVNAANETNYASTLDGLSSWIDGEQNTEPITNLEAFFNTWDDYDKGHFLYNNEDLYRACATD